MGIRSESRQWDVLAWQTESKRLGFVTAQERAKAAGCEKLAWEYWGMLQFAKG